MNNLRDAYEQGAYVATNYSIGKPFLGAYGEAERLGYSEKEDKLAWSVFITAYLGHLPRPVRVDEEGRIVSVG
jgi:hypothetical protein